MPEFVPEGYNLDGESNHQAISHFEEDEWVVIKDPLGWYSRGMDRVSPEEAHDKYGSARDMTVEKYVPFIRGVGRVLTMNHGANFQVVCSYLMVPDSWRTGEGVSVTHELTDCPDDLRLFAHDVTKRSGLYLNGMDYIERAAEDRTEGQNKYALLEVNAVPNLRVPLHYLGVDAPGKFAEHVEQSALQR
jgi:glutathione synthase/RimK-type ligase-like ATP-grasp enzyme